MKILKLLPFLMTALALIACGATDPNVADAELTVDTTARDRLEEQGILYSTEDWEKTVRRICSEDKPGVYMGIDSEIQKYRNDLTDDERANMVLSASRGGEAPNADVLTDREKKMVIDVVIDDACGKPNVLTSTVEKEPGDLADRIETR